MITLSFYKAFFLVIFFQHTISFKEQQLLHNSVQEIYKQYYSDVLLDLKKHSIDTSQIDLFIRVFKEEEVLEIWGKNRKDESYSILETYNGLQGDSESDSESFKAMTDMPEGLYTINKLQPSASLYLQIFVNSPNTVDNIRRFNPGGIREISLCGEGKQTGKIQLKNNEIAKLYIYLVETIDKGEKYIPIHIFPFRMTAENMKSKQEQFKTSSDLLKFWSNLEPAWSGFQRSKKIPRWSPGRGGYFYH